MPDHHHYREAYSGVRRHSEALCASLSVEDHCVQPFTEASPAKWNLAHTTWFFERMVLRDHLPSYREANPAFGHLFNSYYEIFGDRVSQGDRGRYSRPTLEEVYAYRRAVDEAIIELIDHAPQDVMAKAWPIMELGLNHEQQHQELMVTDVKAALFQPPLFPAWHNNGPTQDPSPATGETEFAGGVIDIGHHGDGFAYDNELPRHRMVVEPFRLANDLVTNGEYIEFMDAGGYEDPQFWLSDGWAWCISNGIEAPMYWMRREGVWWTYTTGGLRRVRITEPVTHVSYYEAWAYARWAGAQLPTENQWEHAAIASRAAHHPGTLLEDGHLHPIGTNGNIKTAGPRNLIGELWEWTESSYSPYPGYQRPPGAYSEYNGKFMINQMVLRGGSCATPRSHIRATYRNFFAPDKRWQFTGIRLSYGIL